MINGWRVHVWSADLLICWSADLLICWSPDLQICWTAKLLSCWAAELLICWSAHLLICSSADLLICSAADLLICWSADQELLICWSAEVLNYWSDDLLICCSSVLICWSDAQKCHRDIQHARHWEGSADSHLIQKGLLCLQYLRHPGCKVVNPFSLLRFANCTACGLGWKGVLHLLCILLVFIININKIQNARGV